MMNYRRLALALCSVMGICNVGAQEVADSNDYHYLTTANTVINVDDFATGVETDVWHFLIGKIPGLDITIEGESAYGIGAFRMRGGPSAMSNKSDLLWIVDGLYQPCGDVISALNPNDIESIRVLRDAAAIAPYGEAGANGVVVIKTRHPSDGKLTFAYDGNGSMNTYDFDKDNRSYSTKHNVSMSGAVADMPYRAAFGYNLINSVWDNVDVERFSGNLWFGPRLLDNHLRIDVNGYSRWESNWLINTEMANRNIIGRAAIDYAVHSLESLHVNLTGGINYHSAELSSDDVNEVSDRTDKMLDANINYNHQFAEKQSVEGRVGVSLWDNQLDETAFYAQVYANTGSIFLNANARYSSIDQEFGDNQKRLSASYSMGVKPIDALTVRAGVGALGLNAGEKPSRNYSDNAVGKTLSINLGTDFNFLKNRLSGSVDFYYHKNYDEKPNYVEEDGGYFFHRNVDLDALSLKNRGIELLLNAKIIDAERVKWNVRATFAANKYAVGYKNAEHLVLQQTDDGLIFLAEDGGKPLTFFVMENVYTKDGDKYPSLYRDLDGDGEITEKDYVPYHSPIPSATAGFSTRLDVYGAYLQIDGHSQIDRYNIIGVSTPESCDVHNSSFLRIDNVVLGYKFDHNGLSGKIYVAASDFMVFTKAETTDPELVVGYDQGYNFRRPTIFSLGLKLNINLKD